MARSGVDPASEIVVVTSRLSIEMIQKLAAARVPIVAAVSAPTALAVQAARSAAITLIAIARCDEFDIFTLPHRVRGHQVAASEWTWPRSL